MLKPIALFINGVFASVLDEILETQSALPEQILFLQPYSGYVIKKLRDDVPSVESPMRLFLSITDDLATIRYQAEIVGWRDKRDLSQDEKQSINRVIAALQKGERELYNDAPSSTGENVNLLYVRRLQKVSSPFSVAQLRKLSDGEPLSTARTTAGGYSYVETEVLELAASS
ncbi:MAG: hypothetical protein KME15_17550 [Drouetiella hepatica Uher 2000/2452]|jgi:hypothetical protein|uniref:Uncharacterized protein n=1 Tax=Drouetiella hepatica Uher 2000/2452 TaxID=904376 RepID=A0A951QEV0_9CYAN|nr:hypothetical protein [Drouetiella hepatica Uher 2000/2452]